MAAVYPRIAGRRRFVGVLAVCCVSCVVTVVSSVERVCASGPLPAACTPLPRRPSPIAPIDGDASVTWCARVRRAGSGETARAETDTAREPTLPRRQTLDERAPYLRRQTQK